MAIEHATDGSFTDPKAEDRWKSLQNAGLTDGQIWKRMKREGFFREELVQEDKEAAVETTAAPTPAPSADEAFRTAVSESKRIFAEADEHNRAREAARQAELDQRVHDAISGSHSDTAQS